MKKTIYHFCGVLFVLAGLFGGLYVGGWVLFISPIIEACKAFDMGTLTGLMVSTTIIKCIFASTIGGAISYLGLIIGKVLLAK